MTFNAAWLSHLKLVIDRGRCVAPRGHGTRELWHATVTTDMRQSVLTVEARKLNYQFMAAEAYWILSGDDTVAGIAPYNKHIASFSDDGERFFGAYGPKIVNQLPYVVAKLVEDPLSRQAGLTIWRESPPPTKDVPCTVAIFCSLRDSRLDVSVYMRSSDVWLGLPYDVFNFSMLGHLICCRLWARGVDAVPGTLAVTATSSHLYERDLEAAMACPFGRSMTNRQSSPNEWWLDEQTLMSGLMALRTSRRGDPLRWWERWYISQ